MFGKFNSEKYEQTIVASRSELTEAYEALGNMLRTLNATNEQCELVFNTIGLAEFIGNLEGVNVYEGFDKTPLSAVKGRKLIGEASKEKIRAAVQPYRNLSKEKAAEKIKDVVNLDAGTIRRHLITMFPGEKWRCSDASPDAS